MKQLLSILVLTCAPSTPVWAAEQTVTLSVPGMTCGVCPITVRKALDAVPGVEKVSIDETKKNAVVTFDDAKTNLPALTQATANAGYPSTIVGVSK